VGELWDNSWQILLVSYGLLVLIAGVIAMGYQTVQTRHSIKELAPRLVVGFLAGACRCRWRPKTSRSANALVAASMGGGVDANSAGETLRSRPHPPRSRPWCRPAPPRAVRLRRLADAARTRLLLGSHGVSQLGDTMLSSYRGVACGFGEGRPIS
jgi:peptidoglycan/LPS O-acetylase OafA/YrhL